MRVVSIGLDLSLSGSGMVVLEADRATRGINTLEADIVRPSALANLNRYALVDFIASAVASKVSEYQPREIVIEGYGQATHGGVQSFVKLAEVGTMVRMLLWSADASWIELPPSSLKKFVTDNGKANKKGMIDGVYKQWGFSTKDHNIADAFGCAAFGLARAGAIPVTLWQAATMGRTKHG